MNTLIKKISYTLLFTLALACTPDDGFYVEPYTEEVPQNLLIGELVGIKLNSNFATNEVKMNVKLEHDGKYYIKVVNISGKVVAKELVNGKVGDNLFTVYTATLPKSSYRLELFDDNIKVGNALINLQ